MKLIKRFITCLAAFVVLTCFGGGIHSMAAEVAPDLIPVPMENIYQEETPDNVKSYSITIPTGMTEVVKKIEIPCRGQLIAPIDGVSLPQSVEVNIYSDEACTKKVSNYTSLSTTAAHDVLEGKIMEKGTFYLKLSYYRAADADGEITIAPYIYSGEDKTLENDRETGTYPVEYTPVYHKVVMDKAGYITLTGKGRGTYENLTVNLCDGKKKERNSNIYLNSENDYTTYFGLGKGTYYITVKSFDPYTLKYKASSVADQSGASKAKAVSINKNATKKGLVLAADSKNKSDWFKIKLSKKQNIKFDLTTKTSDRINFKIVPANSRQIIWGDSVSLGGNDKFSVVSEDKFAAGTYYIQVTAGTFNGNGYYTIKCK